MAANWFLIHQSDFSIFPDFESYRDQLKKRRIETSTALCEQLLQDTGVAILPGVDFGRSRDELTARIAFVDFDGREALLNYSENTLLHGNFIEKYCGRTLKAMGLIVEWLTKL